MIHKPSAATSALIAAPTGPLLFAVTVKSPARPRMGAMAPNVTALFVIVGGDVSWSAWSAAYLQSIEQAAQTLNISVTPIEIHNQSEIEQKITALGKPNVGLIFPPNSFTSDHRPQIIELVTARASGPAPKIAPRAVSAARFATGLAAENR